MRNLLRAAAAALVTSLMLSSCASIKVDSIPLPGNSYEGGYNIIAEFASVLNMPDRAKVVMDGTTIGVVEEVSTTSRQAEVTARISADVSVPADVHAALQQATVLGDIYVALDRPTGDRPPASPLPPGGRIPIDQTTSPPQIEDTIANLANFIGSGSIQRAQNTLIGVNRVTPPPLEVRAMASRVATDMSDLSNNVANVDRWLSGISELGDVGAANSSEFQYWFSPEGVQAYARGNVIAGFFGRLFPSLGTVYSGGWWIVPMLGSLASAMGSVQQAKWTVGEEYPKWRNLFIENFLRQDKYPAINITSIVGPDGRELSGNIEQVLRMLGAPS